MPERGAGLHKSCILALAFTIQVSVKVVTQVLGILISKRKAVIGENYKRTPQHAR